MLSGPDQRDRFSRLEVPKLDGWVMVVVVKLAVCGVVDASESSVVVMGKLTIPSSTSCNIDMVRREVSLTITVDLFTSKTNRAKPDETCWTNYGLDEDVLRGIVVIEGQRGPFQRIWL